MTTTTIPAKVQKILDAAVRYAGLTVVERQDNELTPDTRMWEVKNPARPYRNAVWVYWTPGQNAAGRVATYVWDPNQVKSRRVTVGTAVLAFQATCETTEAGTPIYDHTATYSPEAVEDAAVAPEPKDDDLVRVQLSDSETGEVLVTTEERPRSYLKTSEHRLWVARWIKGYGRRTGHGVAVKVLEPSEAGNGGEEAAQAVEQARAVERGEAPSGSVVVKVTGRNSLSSPSGERPKASPVVPEVPNGSVSRKWFSEGYQAAMIDIATKLEEGGEDAVREWVENNLRRR